jgi:hypothetical protein
MARKPLGPFSIVPQFDDMLGELGGYAKMPAENHVSEILGDPIFQAPGEHVDTHRVLGRSWW